MTRSYFDLQCDALGEGCDAETARTYANGPAPLRRLISYHGDEDDDEPEARNAGEEQE